MVKQALKDGADIAVVGWISNPRRVYDVIAVDFPWPSCPGCMV